MTPFNLELANAQIFPASYRGKQVDFFPPEQLAPLEAEHLGASWVVDLRFGLLAVER